MARRWILASLLFLAPSVASAFVVSWAELAARQIGRAAQPEVLRCYREEIESGLEWQGRLEARVRVDPRGEVHPLHVGARPRVSRRTLIWCVRDALRAVRVRPPHPADPNETTVAFTLVR